MVTRPSLFTRYSEKKALLATIIHNQMQWIVLNPYLCLEQGLWFLLVNDSRVCRSGRCLFQKVLCFSVRFYEGFVWQVRGWNFFQKCFAGLAFRDITMMNCVNHAISGRGLFSTFPFVISRVMSPWYYFGGVSCEGCLDLSEFNGDFLWDASPID